MNWCSVSSKQACEPLGIVVPTSGEIDQVTQVVSYVWWIRFKKKVLVLIILQRQLKVKQSGKRHLIRKQVKWHLNKNTSKVACNKRAIRKENGKWN